MASWETPWMSLASFVIVLWMFSITVSGDTLRTSSNPNLDLPSKLPCPDPEVIVPCKCSFSATLGMDMDCSNVMSEDELRRVFSNDFAFESDFRKFTITHNQNIQWLREGDLGSVSFTQIHIEYTSLTEIEDRALERSYHTLDNLNLNNNRLKFLPDISAFTRLIYLQARSNDIHQFPSGSSASVLELDLSDNQIDDVPDDSVKYMTKLERLTLYENSLTEIRPNTFTRNENLNFLSLGRNKLTTIPDDAITLHGQRTELYLENIQLTSLTYEAVSSVNGGLYVDHNNLTEVPEKVFRPLLEDSVDVYLYENPFKCGCDMAWLVLNQTLLNRIFSLDYTKCSDGQYFTDLHPEVYKVMCPNATAVPLKLQ